jgi:putative radical SAM enzyme (TIGR03279 family)
MSVSVQPAKKYKNQVEENEASRIARNEAVREGVLPRESTAARTAYGRGVVLSEIDEGSIAQEIGLSPGDRLVAINEEPARDAIQLRLADSREVISLTVIGQDGAPQVFDIEKDPFEPVGLHVDSELFDGVKRCSNKCPFCFVDQLPPRLKQSFGAQEKFKNLRRTLYVRDDDYRLSFLHGHYITLTNLKEEDYARIIGEKLSPLCVSVHATDPETRIRMVGNTRAGDIMEKLRKLIDGGVTVNAQIVLCPGVNDGEILRQSVLDLLELYPAEEGAPGVESCAVVPVGLTQWMPQDRGMRIVEPHEATQVLELLKPLQRRARRRHGARFVYASDEMYLLAGQEMPSARYYDGFPQYANGVGTIRAFLDEVARLRRRRVKVRETPPKITLVTGKLAASALRELSGALNEKGLAHSQVVEIVPKFWGGNVGCAGLIMGEEVREQLRGIDCGEMTFLPPDAVDNQSRMLDDITLAELSREFNTQMRADAHGPLHLAQLLGRN